MKKEKVISALKKNVKLYEEVAGKRLLTIADDHICKLFVAKKGTCVGCPLAAEDGISPGCVRFKSFKDVESSMMNIGIHIPSEEISDGQAITLRKVLHKRALFFKKVVKHIKEWPEERFTKKGWKFIELPYTM